MNEEGFVNCLQAVLEGELEVNESFDPDGIRSARTFRDLGVMTHNHGLVVRMDDGSEYQVTVVRSR
jgi:hypothetical protein